MSIKLHDLSLSLSQNKLEMYLSIYVAEKAFGEAIAELNLSANVENGIIIFPSLPRTNTGSASLVMDRLTMWFTTAGERERRSLACKHMIYDSEKRSLALESQGEDNSTCVECPGMFPT